jgi:tRNA A37 N6-isopentenylltransferase MiaA
VNEVKALIKAGAAANAPGMLSLGYSDIAAAIANHEDPEEALARVVVITRQYAKRQETFFRSEKDAVWIDMSHTGAVEQARTLVNDFLRPVRPH